MKGGGGDLPYALRLLASGQTVGDAWKEAGYASRKALADDIYRAADGLGSVGEEPRPSGGPQLDERPSRKSPRRGLKLVAYSDGASSGNPGHAGCGVVLLDQSGEVLLEDYRYLGETTNNVAEYQGAILALTRALELGASEIELMVDSGLLANQIKGGYKVRSVSLAPLYHDLKRLSERFARFEIRQITRGENRQADRLANLAVASRTKE
jgi:ribonuclease HI